MFILLFLSLCRNVFVKDKCENKQCIFIDIGKLVIFLQYGFLFCLLCWVENLVNESFGFMFVDVGVDVWFGNNRGNKYFKSYVSFSFDDLCFWEFRLVLVLMFYGFGNLGQILQIFMFFYLCYNKCYNRNIDRLVFIYFMFFFQIFFWFDFENCLKYSDDIWLNDIYKKFN